MAKDEKPSWVRDLGIFGLVLTEVLGWTGAGMAIGYLSWKYGPVPMWITPVLALGGLVIALMRVYRAGKK